MSEKIRIKNIKTIEDCDGRYGPQKKICFTDYSDRYISGWIPANKFEETHWIEECEIELEIIQNGKYLNFKLPKEEKDAGAKKPAPDVWAAINSIKKRLDALENKRSASAPIAVDTVAVAKDVLGIDDESIPF